MQQQEEFACLAASLFGIIIGISATILLVWLDLRRQKHPFKIYISDFVIGKRHWIEEYGKKRISEVDALLNDIQLKEKNLELQNITNDLALKERELEVQYKYLEESSRDKVFISLPEDKKFLIGNKFLEDLPDMHDRWMSFLVEMTSNTNNYIDRVTGESGYDEVRDTIKSYLTHLCCSISTRLFNPESVRVHLRFRTSDGVFKKIVASTDSPEKMGSCPMTPIDQDDSMIGASIRNLRSMIKSFYPKYHQAGQNDKIWKDYITSVFNEIRKDGQPLLSMGISFKFPDKHSDASVYLVHIMFEQKIQLIIQQFLHKIKTKVGTDENEFLELYLKEEDYACN